jgi:hypothetical protein
MQVLVLSEHKPYKQSTLFEQEDPISPEGEFKLKQIVFESPISPLYPLKQLPQVLIVRIHSSLLNTPQSGAEEQFTVPTVELVLR